MFSTTNRRRLTCVGTRCNQRNDPEQQTMNLADDFDTWKTSMVDLPAVRQKLESEVVVGGVDTEYRA